MPEQIILTGDEIEIAQRAVRLLLLRCHMNYRQNARKGRATQAARNLEKFDDALDLFQRLGGDPDSVLDPEDAPEARAIEGATA